jgi:hypothetical protein
MMALNDPGEVVISSLRSSLIARRPISRRVTLLRLAWYGSRIQWFRSRIKVSGLFGARLRSAVSTGAYSASTYPRHNWSTVVDVVPERTFHQYAPFEHRGFSRIPRSCGLPIASCDEYNPDSTAGPNTGPFSGHSIAQDKTSGPTSV